MKKRELLTVFVFGILLASVASAQEATSTSCIDVSVKPDIEVIRQIVPPKIIDQNNYIYYPGSIFSTLDSPSISSLTSEYNFERNDLFHFLWANRCNNCAPNTKGNGPEIQFGSKGVRFYFTTHNKANTCTILQLRKLLNNDRETIKTLATSAGLRVAYNKEHVRGLLKNGDEVWDTCYLSGADGVELSSSSGMKGIVLDYEVQDNRAPEITSRFVDSINRILGDKKLLFYTNDVVGPQAIKSGINASSAKNILQSSDGVGVLLHQNLLSSKTINSAITSQMNVYGASTDAERKKVYLVFEMNLSLAQAVQVRNYVKTKNLLGVMEWRNGNWPKPIGNSCQFNTFESFHQKMICLSYGICS
jgi:ribosomal protein L33